MEAESEVHRIESTGDGTVYPSAEPWEELLRREHPAVDLTAQEQDNCWKRRSFPAPEKEVKRDTGPVLFLFVSDGCSKAEAEKNLPGAPADIRKLDARIEQMEFLQKYQITTREELMAYRTPLEEQVQALTKERKRLYRSEPDSVRIGQITEKLRPLRKDIRLCIRIEQQSKEMEEKMCLAEQIQRQAEQTEKNRQPRTESR